MTATRQEIVTAMNWQAPAQAPVAIDAARSILDVIERVAMDPTASIEKMERLLTMHDRIHNQQARMAFDAALAAMQAELPVIEERGAIKDRGGVVQSRYALWEDIAKAIRPVLQRHGFALTFRVDMGDAKISVTGILSHAQGHREETTIALPSDTTGSKNAVQAIGSSVSYGKRYTAGALLNLASGDIEADDDGQAAGVSGVVSIAQFDELRLLIDEANADEKLFCEHFGVASVADLPAARFEAAVTTLRKKIRKNKDAGNA